MPDPIKLLGTIRRAASLFRSTPGRAGGVVALPADQVDDLLVVGDLHGNLPPFTHFLKLAALDANPRRHLILQELIHDPKADPTEGRLDLSHRLVDLVCALKCQYPDRVHLILGNHELSELTGRSISKGGFAINALFRAGLESSYGPHADAILAAYFDLFRALPLVVRTPNRVLVVHTLPDARDLDALDLGLLNRSEWPPDALQRGGTIYAMTWGRDTSDATADRFAAMVDADLFLCGHQPCDDGFRVANARTLIIDGTDPYPAACLVPADKPLTIEDLAAGVRVLSPTAG